MANNLKKISRSILLTVESYRKFLFQCFNFLFVEAAPVQAHERTKRSSQMAAVIEDAKAEIFLTFKWKQYILGILIFVTLQVNASNCISKSSSCELIPSDLQEAQPSALRTIAQRKIVLLQEEQGLCKNTLQSSKPILPRSEPTAWLWYKRENTDEASGQILNHDSYNQNLAPSPCSPPTCRFSPYSGPNCIPVPYCREINLRGELLYWTAELGGLEAAFGTTKITISEAEGITKTVVKESDKEPNWQWRPGYRVGIDYAFACFVLEADWTHYDGHAKFNEDRQHGHWKIRYDTLDLLFGRRCSVAPCFYFKPFFGVRGLLAHQSLKSNLQVQVITLTTDNTIYTVKNDKEHFWGFGPELGLEADWYLGWHWSLYASFDVVSYYGRVKNKTFNTDSFSSTINVRKGSIKHCFNTIGADGSIGLRWDKAWSVASEVLLTIKLGLEQHRIYDFSNLGSDGTLSLDGANLALSLGYRY